MSERLFTITPAFDKRHPEPNKNYGILGCTLRWVLKGDEGAVQFVLYTDWHLAHVRDELRGKYGHNWSSGPFPADLGYHSPHPMYEGHSVVSDECEYIAGPCYYDGSGLAADGVFDKLCEGGNDAVWPELEAYYADVFSPAGVAS